MLIETIAIESCNNDFSWMIEQYMVTLHRVLEWNKSWTPENFTRLVLEGFKFHYLAFQNEFRYGGHAHIDYTEKYLIMSTKILYNEEALASYENKDCDGATVILDVKTGQINRY